MFNINGTFWTRPKIGASGVREVAEFVSLKGPTCNSCSIFMSAQNDEKGSRFLGLFVSSCDAHTGLMLGREVNSKSIGVSPDLELPSRTFMIIQYSGQRFQRWREVVDIMMNDERKEGRGHWLEAQFAERRC